MKAKARFRDQLFSEAFSNAFVRDRNNINIGKLK
jgi:hypothetical protein